MQQPEQHRFESQALRTKQAPTTTWARQKFPMVPHPHVTQNQGQGNKEKPHLGIARTGPDARLTQLPITRLNAETLAIRVGHPAPRSRLEPPVGIDPGVTPVLLPRSTVVAAIHTDRHRGFFLARDQRVFTPTAAFP